MNNLTFEVPDGVVVGFVGPNGSGKSTTIRVLLGLIEASGGTGTVLGEPIEHPERFADRVGALIESPALVGSLSGRDNLRSLAALRGLPGERVDEVLEIVGLVGREGDKASTYSLGMKQRLGIAAALLPDPEMLVLDEPTNGLDPAGIVEIPDRGRDRRPRRGGVRLRRRDHGRRKRHPSGDATPAQHGRPVRDQRRDRLRLRPAPRRGTVGNVRRVAGFRAHATARRRRVKRVVEEAHDEAIRLLIENRSRLDRIAEALLREETLDQPQAYAAAGLAPPPEDEAAPLESAKPVAM